MYWRIESSEWPQPDWDRDTVCGTLPPFIPEPVCIEAPALLAYCRFYGLDIEADHSGVTHYLGYIDAAGYRVALHEYRVPDSRGTVFVLHGYFDHAGLYSRLFEHLLEQGYNVVCHDLPGHGLSSGEPAAIDSFDDYQHVLAAVLRQAEGRLAGPWFAIGQSTGGAVLIDYLLSNGHTPESSAFRRVVLLAPLVRPMSWSAGRALHSVIKPFTSTWKRAFSRNSGSERFLRFLREHDPLQSRVLSVTWVGALKEWVPRIERAAPVDVAVTVIQGERDRTVDWRYNLRVIRKKFTHCRVYRLPQGHHHLVNESAPLLDKVFSLIDCTIAGRSHA